MPKCETIVANQPGGSGGVPAEAAALFFGGLFDEGQGFGTPVLAAGGEERVDERDGRDIGSAEGCGFNRGEKDLVALAGKGGEIGVCDADAIGAVRLGLLRAFDGLAKAAAETDGNHQVFPTHAASEMKDAPSGSGGKNRQTENAHLIFEIVGQSGGQISRKDKNPAGRTKKAFEGGQALGVAAVFMPPKIFDLPLCWMAGPCPRF